MQNYTLRRGFTLIDIILSLSALLLVTAISVPLYRQYMLQSDLDIAQVAVVQALHRAQLLAQINMEDSSWGFSTDDISSRGVIFKGPSYALRDADFDELQPIPQSVSIAGLSEVTFQKNTGIPSTEGTIELSSSNKTRTVYVGVNEQGGLYIEGNPVVVCNDPYGENRETVEVSDSLFSYLSLHGSLLGDCDTITLDINSVVPSVGNVSLTKNGYSIEPSQNYTCSVSILGSNTLAAGGYSLPATLRIYEAGVWQEIFGSFQDPLTGNIVADTLRTENCVSSSIAAGTPMHLHARSWQKKYFWYDGSTVSDWKQYADIRTDLASNHVQVLVDGDSVPTIRAFESLSNMQPYLHAYIDQETDKVALGQDQALYLFELTDSTIDTNSDFQDMVILVTFNAA